MSPTFFEGPEKKVEIVVHRRVGSLRELGGKFWQGIVTSAGASVLSCRSTSEFDSYLLSESSLFVFDRQVTMITCGQTTLAEAALRIIEKVEPENIALLVYERKNEHFPEKQYSSFYEDAGRLNRVIPGRALRFGDEHDHRIMVFAAAQAFEPATSDVTLEVLMHGIDAERAGLFLSREGHSRSVVEESGLAELFVGYDVDEYLFSPAGYSVNAVHEGRYYTVHVTPEVVGSYVSFETNVDFRDDPSRLIEAVVSIFRPDSFDVLAFCPQVAVRDILIDGYRVRRHVVDRIVGYSVTFMHFFAPKSDPASAFAIELPI